MTEEDTFNKLRKPTREQMEIIFREWIEEKYSKYPFMKILREKGWTADEWSKRYD